MRFVWGFLILLSLGATPGYAQQSFQLTLTAEEWQVLTESVTQIADPQVWAQRRVDGCRERLVQEVFDLGVRQVEQAYRTDATKRSQIRNIVRQR